MTVVPPSRIVPGTELSAPAEEPPPPRSRRRLVHVTIFSALCLAAGLAGSLGLDLRADVAAPDSTATSAAHSPPDPWTPGSPPPPEPEARTDLDRIDRILRSGDFARALKLCRTADRSDETCAAPLRYREALCQEGLDQRDKAADAYRAVTEDEFLRPWAALGEARCALAAGDLERARVLVSQALLCSGSDRTAFVECLFMRARLKVAELKPSTAPDPLDPADLAWPPVTESLDHAIERLLARRQTPDNDPIPAAERGPVPACETPITLDLPPRGVPDLLGDLAAAAGLNLALDVAARSRLATASAAVHIVRVPLAEVLAALTEVHGVQCQIIDSELRVSLANQPGRARDRAEARAVLRRALAASEHPAALAAEVWLANLEVEEGRLRGASIDYLNILSDAPNSAESVHAAYNLGLVEMRLGHLESARSRFLDVVDRGPGTRWADIGWWWIGRAHLDSGDTTAAVRPLQTALHGSSSEVASAAVLGLGACHILAGDDAAARRILRSYRVGPKAMHAATAEMLASYLHFRVSPSEGRRTIVHSAINEARNGEALGLTGLYLAGLALRDTGESNQMVAMYERALETARGPLAVQMTHAIGERQMELDRRREARSCFQAVVAADAESLGTRAQLRLAELDALDGNGADCVARCRGLLARPGVDTQKVLAILGQGYELQRDFRRAAEAFAGRVPAE
jgi:tetratricopeptide (TPR) repeat protein